MTIHMGQATGSSSSVTLSYRLMLSPFPRWCPYCGRLDVELLNVQAPTRHNPAGDLDSYGSDKEEVAETPSSGVTPLASTNTPAGSPRGVTCGIRRHSPLVSYIGFRGSCILSCKRLFESRNSGKQLVAGR